MAKHDGGRWIAVDVGGLVGITFSLTVGFILYSALTHWLATNMQCVLVAFVILLTHGLGGVAGGRFLAKYIWDRSTREE